MEAIAIETLPRAPLGADVPLEIPEPNPAHPLRWRRVLSLMREVRQAEIDRKVEAALELFDAVGGLGGEATFTRFVRKPAGRRLLRTRPDLVAILADRDLLRGLPEGSLGRAYLDFSETNDVAADDLVELNNSVERERSGMDRHRDWFWDRFTASHDLWHVITNCSTEGEGELRLLAFTFAQTPQRGYAILLALSTFPRLFEFGFLRDQWRAWRAGRRAADLISVAWEEYLAWPLDEVRRVHDVEVLDA